jgi:hypothetical protein
LRFERERVSWKRRERANASSGDPEEAFSF